MNILWWVGYISLMLGFFYLFNGYFKPAAWLWGTTVTCWIIWRSVHDSKTSEE